MRLWASILGVFGTTCLEALPPPERDPPIPGVELHFAGSATDALTLVGRLADRPFVFDDPKALAKVKVAWSTAGRWSVDTYANALEEAFVHAEFSVRHGDPTIIGPGPDVRRITLVYVKLPVDGLEKLVDVDLDGTWFRPIDPGGAVVSCACGFPIVPIALTDAAVAETPPRQPLLVDVVASIPPLAVIRDVDSERAQVVERWDFLADGRAIAEIAEAGILLDDGELVSRFEVDRPKPKRRFTGSVVAGTDSYRLERSTLAPWLMPETASMLGAAVPTRGSDGTVQGVRLSALRRGELPEALGFENGDVVHRVGAVEVRGAEDFPAVVGALGAPGEICVQVSRRGEPIRLCYTLDD